MIRNVIFMKRNSFDHDAYMKSKMLSYSPKASYEDAVKVYKLFTYVSVSILTVVCLIFMLL